MNIHTRVFGWRFSDLILDIWEINLLRKASRDVGLARLKHTLAAQCQHEDVSVLNQLQVSPNLTHTPPQLTCVLRSLSFSRSLGRMEHFVWHSEKRSLNTATFPHPPSTSLLSVFHTLPPYGKPDSHFPVRRKQWEWTARPLTVNQHIIVSEENHLTRPAPCSHKVSRGKAASTRGTRNSPTGHKQLSRWEMMTKRTRWKFACQFLQTETMFGVFSVCINESCLILFYVYIISNWKFSLWDFYGCWNAK